MLLSELHVVVALRGDRQSVEGAQTWNGEEQRVVVVACCCCCCFFCCCCQRSERIVGRRSGKHGAERRACLVHLVEVVEAQVARGQQHVVNR